MTSYKLTVQSSCISRAKEVGLDLLYRESTPPEMGAPSEHPPPLPRARRRIRACSIPSTIRAPRQTDPAFLVLLRATLLDLKREQVERAFKTASAQTADSADAQNRQG